MPETHSETPIVTHASRKSNEPFTRREAMILEYCDDVPTSSNKPGHSEAMFEASQADLERGEPSAALEKLLVLQRINPGDVRVITRILVICLHIRPDLDTARRAVAAIEPAIEREPHLELLLADYWIRQRDFARYAAHLQHAQVSLDAHPWWVWKTWLEAAGFRLLIEQTIQMTNGDPNHMGWKAVPQLLACLLHCCRHPNDLHANILQAGFYNLLHLTDSHACLQEAFRLLSGKLDVEQRAMLFSYYVSMDLLDDAAQILRSESRLDEPLSNPRYAKYIALYAIKIRDTALEIRVLQHALLNQYSATTFMESAVEAREIRTRALNSPLQVGRQNLDLPPVNEGLPIVTHFAPKFAPEPARPRVFLGIFGQLRSPETILPKMYRGLRADLQAIRDQNSLDVDFALATWNKIGARSLDHGLIDIAFQLIPMELVELCRGTGIDTLEKFSDYMPNIAKRINGQKLKEFSSETLLKWFPSLSSFRLSDEAQFDRWYDTIRSEDGRAVAPLPHVRNQMKMWNRIEALGEMMMNMEIERGYSYDGYILLRTDFIPISGSLFSSMCDILRTSRPRDFVADYDACATYLCGLGDRYMMGTRADTWQLFAIAQAIHKVLLNPEGRYTPYLQRLGGHQMLGTMTFEQGMNLRQLHRSAIDFEIFRDRLSLDDLRNELHADASQSTNSTIRGGLAMIISRIDA